MNGTTAAKPGVHRLVGVIHLPPLPGSARGPSAREFQHVLDHARRDAATWTLAGANALIVENFGDVPFCKGPVGPETVAAMTLAVSSIIAESGLPVGVNVLRNDVEAAVAIAAMSGGSFVRANVYVGAAVTDQGMIEGRADAVQALVRTLGAPVEVWADVDVKHAAQIAPRPVGELAVDAITRGLANALIVTGPGTGRPTDLGDVQAVRAAMPRAPIYVGSGATPASLPSLLANADGVIVGTGAKIDADPENPIDLKLARALVAAARSPSGQ